MIIYLDLKCYFAQLSAGKDDEKELETTQQIPIKETLTATNGKTVEASVVFIAAFKELQKQANSYLKRNKVSKKLFKKCTTQDIQWIITVPAIWNDKAKYRMRQWTIDAGLVDPDIPDQCKIVYEPDCASLAIQYEINRSKSLICNFTDDSEDEDAKNEHQYEFTKGEKYILVDAGGGTVDVACHEILGDNGQYGVKEILPPSGGPWGSCCIDDQFIELLKKIFKPEWVEEFSEEQPNIYIHLLDNFQSAKADFYKEPQAKSHNVRLPVEFIGFIQDKLEEVDSDESDAEDVDIEDVVAAATFSDESKLST